MKKLTMALSVAAATAWIAPPAAAGTILMSLQDVTGGVTATCDNVNVAACGGFFFGTNNANVLSFGPNGTIGSFSTALTSAATNSPGTPTQATIGIVSLVLTNNTDANRTFQVTATAFNFTQPPGDPLTFFGSASSSTNGATAAIVHTAWFDPANTGALLNPITCNMALGGGDLSDNCDTNTIQVNNGGGMYSMTDRLTIVIGARQSVLLTGNATVNSVPEPATLLLVGFGLLGAGLARRRTTK